MTWLDQWRTAMRMMGPLSPDTTSASPMVFARPMQSASALPGNLRRLREARGLTVAQLSARTAGEDDGPVSRSTIRLIEAGNRNPTLSTLLALALALEVGVEALVEEGQ